MADRNSALRRLSGTKKGVDLTLPTPGENEPRAPKAPDLSKGRETPTRETPTLNLSGSPVVPDRGATVLGMSVDKFSQLARGLGASLAPDTPMGRAGAFVSNLASSNIAKGEAAATKAEDRANTIEDLKNKWLHEGTVTTEDRAYSERRDKTSWDRGEPARDLQKQVYEKKLGKKTDIQEYQADPEGYKDYKEAGRGKSSSKVTYYGKDGSELVAQNEADQKQAISRGMSRVKPGSKDGKQVAVDTLSRYEDELDPSIRPIDALKERANTGDRIAIDDLSTVLQGYGRLPEGTNVPYTNNKTGERVFFNRETETYFDMEGRAIKVGTPEIKMGGKVKKPTSSGATGSY